MPGVTAQAKLSFSKDFTANGSVSAITLAERAAN
jgi:hypothetical protein